VEIHLPNVVYLFGAGVNQVVKDWDGLSPPLLNNFFNVALSKRRFRDDHYSKQLQGVYDYIEKYFRKTKEDLAKSPFDLEICFTLLEQQIKRAQSESRTRDFQELVKIRFQLTSFIANVLSEFEHFVFLSHTMRNLGQVIFYEKPIILTFNYDCLMESVLKTASGVNPNVPKSYIDDALYENDELPEDLLVYSHSKWNKPLAYGFRFDEIQLQQAGVSKFVRGSKFYSISQNQLYEKPLLKLHGSLNWFRYLPFRSFPALPNEPQPKLGEKESDILLKDDTWWFGRPPDHAGWFLEPIIVTPVLYKDEYYNQKPFIEIWEQAKIALSQCDKLVVVGYSFSPSDFTTKQLFFESFMSNSPKELVVVNPNHDLVKVVKELCHFEGGVVWFSSLEEYLQTFSELVTIESEPVTVLETNLPQDTSPHDTLLKCKTCGIEFSASFRTNPRSFATTQIIGYTITCPNGHTHSYNKADFSLKKVSDGVAVSE
jgi:hypothetical protein